MQRRASTFQSGGGFTIVELLIVIVVIAILAAITIVAYNGIQNRANDTAVQADLRNLGNKITEFIALNNSLPDPTVGGIGSLGMKVNRNAYGAHYIPSGGTLEYNMLYCGRSSDNRFMLVAGSKSGNTYAFKNGSVQPGAGPMTTNGSLCSNNDSTMTSLTINSWQYNNSTWVGYL